MPRIVLLVLLCLGSLPAQGADYMALGAGYRFLGLPDMLVNPTFELHQPVMAQGASLSFSLGELESHWDFGLLFGGTMIPDGYWQAAGAKPASAVFVEYNVGFLGAFAGYTWRFVLWDRLTFAPSLGLGVAAVLGDVHATEMIPGCEGDARECGHWRNVTRLPVEFQFRAMPLVIASGQFAYRITDALQVGVDLGIVNLPFVGLTAEYAL